MQIMTFLIRDITTYLRYNRYLNINLEDYICHFIFLHSDEFYYIANRNNLLIK